MEHLIQRVANVLSQAFSDAQPDIEETVPNFKVGGFLVTPDFRGIEQIERHQMVWNALKANLTPEELQQVGVILTLSPAEVLSWTERAA